MPVKYEGILKIICVNKANSKLPYHKKKIYLLTTSVNAKYYPYLLGLSRTRYSGWETQIEI